MKPGQLEALSAGEELGSPSWPRALHLGRGVGSRRSTLTLDLAHVLFHLWGHLDNGLQVGGELDEGQHGNDGPGLESGPAWTDTS